jgi:L-ornithine Nalpha-acyltransferase
VSIVGAFESVIAGNQTIRLAACEQEIEAAQALRYRVFYEEMGAHPLPAMTASGRDFDAFDEACDHLVVIDQSDKNKSVVVGTYRILRDDQLGKTGEFYSANQYDISVLKTHGGAIMELGRSCVDAAFRNRHTMQLLWRGIAEYVAVHNIDLMFGCASFNGIDPKALAQPLSYLYQNHLAPKPLQPRALKDRYCNMALIPPEEIDRKQVLSSLPPLIKGYLRLGAFVGDGAVVDHQFNTTDISIVVKADLMTGRYAKHYALDRPHSPKTDRPSRLRRAS